MKRIVTVAVLASLLFGVGCTGSSKVYVADLNKVLDAFLGAMKSMQKPEEASEELSVAAVEADARDAKREKEFLDKFAAELNKAKVVETNVGASIEADGSILGFTDSNDNMRKDGSDKEIFKLVVDHERDRVIASDTSGGYHRDRHYRSGFGGIFMGYMLGSMLSRQNSFYSTRPRPNYGNYKMSPANYHSQAVSKAKAKARSSGRSRGGSRSYSGGK